MNDYLIRGAVQSVAGNDRSIHLQLEEGAIALSILAPNLLRVRHSLAGKFKPRRSWAVARDDSEWSQVSFQIEETPESIEISTERMRAAVGRKASRLQCFDLDGNPFAGDGEPKSGKTTYNGPVCWKRIEAREHFYGFGERTSLLERRGKRSTNWTVDAYHYQSSTDNLYKAIPFYISLRPGLAYGIFLNTTFLSKFDVGADEANILRMESRDSELDYYIIYGPEPATILETYTKLTGRMPMPPKWALGYHQSRWSYENEDWVRGIAEEMRDRRIPCDAIHLDIDYMRGYRVFTWSPQRFPNPKKLLGDLQQQGFKAVTIIDPGVKYEPEFESQGRYKYENSLPNPIFSEGMAKDCFVRDAGGNLVAGYVWPDKAVFPDFQDPQVRRWWGSKHQDLIDFGVRGIWNDMNEPALDDRPFGEGVKMSFPLDSPQGPPEERATHAEVHNLYGSMMARASYEGLEKLLPQERFFVLTRSGFAGMQRWSAGWTGDNQSSWEHLEMSLPMLCNLGLSGVAFVGSDIGGFFGDCNGELLARWTQIGAFYPFMRNHTMQGSANQEPWRFGDRVEAICREYIELRYRLLPYIYSLFYGAATTGAPVMAPLIYYYPNDMKTYLLHDQVMLGEWLMAAPVCRPGVEYRAVYLPEGVWYDWRTGDRYEGPTHILAPAPLEQMPIYVRGGAIIPMVPVVQYVGESRADELRLKVWPGSGEFTLYEDDGISRDYQTQDLWAKTTYRVRQDADNVTVEIEGRRGNWNPGQRSIVVEVVGVGEERFTDDGSALTLVFG